MIYIVDANNLAGHLGILEEKNFDNLLIEIVGDYFSNKGEESYLIFDGNDPMGDKKKEDGINIVFAPRGDKPYSCADDKILEVVNNKITDENFNNEITVVTDDQELKNKIEDLIKESDIEKRVHIISCAEVSERINKLAEGVNDDYFNPEDLDEQEQMEINEELKEVWN